MSPAEIRSALWSDYLRLARYWADHPPLRDMVQAFLGIKTKSKSAPGPTVGGTTMAALKHAFPGGRI